MDGDEEYAAFVQARWRPLFRSAVLLGCPVHEAEDLVQATLVKCYVSWVKVAAASDQDAYVYRILVNTLRTSHQRWWRREAPSGHLETTRPTVTTEVDAEVVDSVRRALESLTLPTRQVVVLRYFSDLSERQTAEVLGVPTGTVKSRLSRALAQLADNPHLSDLRGWSMP